MPKTTTTAADGMERDLAASIVAEFEAGWERPAGAHGTIDDSDKLYSMVEQACRWVQLCSCRIASTDRVGGRADRHLLLVDACEYPA
jgi:hypothetical protein